MLEKPKVKGHLTIFPVDELTWGVQGALDELSRIRLRNDDAIKVFGALLPFLNGRSSVEDILQELAGQGIAKEPVLDLLERLEDGDLLEEGETYDLTPQELERFSDQFAFFGRYSDQGGAKYQAKLKESRVAVIGQSRLASAVTRQLEEAGCGHIDHHPVPDAVPGSGASGNGSNGNGSVPKTNGSSELQERTLRVFEILESAVLGEGLDAPRPSLVIVTQDRHDPALLEAMDAISKRYNMPWMLLRALGSLEGWVGPLFIPGETACYQSLDARFRANIPFYTEYTAFRNFLLNGSQTSSPCGGLHALFDMVAAMGAVEAIKYLTEVSFPQIASHFVTVNLGTWEMEHHEVLRVPRLGLDETETPTPFPWKEVPHDATEAQKENELRSRRG